VVGREVALHCDLLGLVMVLVLHGFPLHDPTRLPDTDSLHIGCKLYTTVDLVHIPCCLYFKWQCYGHRCEHIQPFF